MNPDKTRKAVLVFDADILMEQVMQDLDLFREVLKAFQTDIPAHFSQIREGIATGQTGLAYRAAHSLKGAARNVGALELAELTGELEQRLQDENLEADTVRLIVDAEAAMDRLCVQLDVLGL